MRNWRKVYIIGLAALLMPPVALLLVAQRPPVMSWSRQFGTPQFDQANGVAVLDGNVYVVGDVIGALPGQTSGGPSDRDAFVRRYDSTGNVTWTRQFGSKDAHEDTATSVVARAGGVYVAGWTAGTLPLQTKLGDNDAFVRKYDVNGNEQWTRQFGTASSVQAFGIAADDSGVYVAGFVDCCNGPFPGIPLDRHRSSDRCRCRRDGRLRDRQHHRSLRRTARQLGRVPRQVHLGRYRRLDPAIRHDRCERGIKRDCHRTFRHLRWRPDVGNAREAANRPVGRFRHAVRLERHHAVGSAIRRPG